MISNSIALVIALPQEAEGITDYPVYFSGCGKVNATIATMKAINDGHDYIINFGTAFRLCPTLPLLPPVEYLIISNFEVVLTQELLAVIV